ncbi:MAG: DUF1674 domain-containing protein [Gammaproteobacteria bacterium]|nr:DUF1674 domain-containing protein [Gammaproteobacteria bacterium]MDH4252912.1 DUF1674 domain-containing protein [Gammaproteobacteria bacterium]MDH5308402.1 DUF1674 domain-containing protein [Gammaproteobacteria bacterium]
MSRLVPVRADRVGSETEVRAHDNPPVENDKLNRPKEIGGRPGPEPTRYGDWEKNGRCIDF